MRNLLISSQDSHSFPPAQQISVNSGQIIGVTPEGLLIFNIQSLTYTQHPLPQISTSGTPLDVTFLALPQQISLIYDSGEIFLLDNEEFEQITSIEIDGGLFCAKWSPSQDYLTILSKEGILALLTPELEPLAQLTLSDLLDAQVSWRGDSLCFQVCYRKSSGIYVRTYNNLLQEDNDYCQSNTEDDIVTSVYDKGQVLDQVKLDWQASGSLIAGINGKKVKLWERNGQIRSDFEVQYEGQVVNLCWSPDSNILLLVLQQENEREILLYIRSNYVWYLKQTIRYPQINHVFWETPDTFWVNTADKLLRLQVRWEYNQYDSLVAVVQGRSLLITNFKQGLLPPPMSNYTIQTDQVIESLDVINVNESLSPQQQIGNQQTQYTPSNRIIYATSGQVYLYTDDKPILIGSYIGRALLLRKLETGVFIQTTTGSYIIHEDQQIEEINLPDPIYAVSQGPSLVLETTKGDCYAYPDLHHLLKLPRPCKFIYTFQVKSEQKIIGFSGTRLYLNNDLLTASCSAVYVNSEFLMFVKVDTPLSELYMFSSDEEIPVKLNGPNVQAELPEPNPNNYNYRKAERGSAIVSVFDDNLILQMPRGNIEGIHPRILILKKALRLLESNRYLEVFLLFRKNKIDLNFIHDLDSEKFMNHIGEFIQQVDKGEYLNLFLTSLNDNDISAVYLKRPLQPFENKVNIICDAFIQQCDPNRHLLTIMTAHAKKQPPELMQILDKVQTLQQKVKSTRHPPHKTQEKSQKVLTAEDVLKYVSWLVNPDKLYDATLGSYNLDLVAMVAQYTQKDPKEYLPYLTELQSLDPITRRYKINCDLKQYKQALIELSNGGSEFDQLALQLIREQRLFIFGLSLFQGREICAEIRREAAEYFLHQRMPKQAAVYYEQAQLYTEAYNCYKQAQCWKLAVKCAELAGIEYQDEFQEIGIQAMERGEYRAAAVIFKNFVQNEQGLVKSLLMLGKYSKAIENARSLDQQGLIQNTLHKLASDLVADINENLKTWNEKLKRLSVVQAGKQKFMEHPELIDETASEYSVDSQFSKMTQYTRGQKRRLQKMRKANAKEGSLLEEDYIIDLLLTIRPDDQFYNRVKSVMDGLILMGDLEQAQHLWQNFTTYQKTTSLPVRTLSHSQFIDKFYTDFSEITRDRSSEDALCDMHSRSFFLQDGLATHSKKDFNNPEYEKIFKLVT